MKDSDGNILTGATFAWTIGKNNAEQIHDWFRQGNNEKENKHKIKELIKRRCKRITTLSEKYNHGSITTTTSENYIFHQFCRIWYKKWEEL